MNVSNKLIDVKLESRLKGLIFSCETHCVAECCGIDAFDFSAVNMAYYLKSCASELLEDEINKIENELDSLMVYTRDFEPDKNGFTCSIEGTNQYFSHEDLTRFSNQIRESLQDARKILAYAESIQQGNGEENVGQ